MLLDTCYHETSYPLLSSWPATAAAEKRQQAFEGYCPAGLEQHHIPWAEPGPKGGGRSLRLSHPSGSRRTPISATSPSSRQRSCWSWSALGQGCSLPGGRVEPDPAALAKAGGLMAGSLDCWHPMVYCSDRAAGFGEAAPAPGSWGLAGKTTAGRPGPGLDGWGGCLM